MTSMRAIVIPEPGADFELVEREIPQPGDDEALVRVHACGVCHSDSMAKDGAIPGAPYPLIPGHEIAGEIAALGERVKGWTVGRRVGVGWFGGNCGHCESCRRGSLIDCENTVIPGVTADGGYADYVVVHASALAAIPDELSPEEAAPLLCAGITTFNALSQAGAPAGGRVAVLGLGGLGHLGVQYARQLGYETIAVARGTEKETLARELGAHHYVDSTDGDPSEQLQALGGVDLVLATVTNAGAMAALFGGLRPDGQLLVIGADPEPLPIPSAALIAGSKQISGHASGTSIVSEDTLRFSARSGVRPMIETLPLERAAEAYEKMMSGDARFRMVLTTG